MAIEDLERHCMLDCKPVSTPMDPGHTISPADCPQIIDPARRLKYQEITGALQYLVQWTRADISFATNELAKVNHNPSEQHLHDAYRVLKYLKGTVGLGITYTRDTQDGLSPTGQSQLERIKVSPTEGPRSLQGRTIDGTTLY